MVNEGFVTDEYLPGRRFYVVFVVLLVTSLLLGFYVTTLYEGEAVAWSAASLSLLTAIVAGFVVPDLAQYAILRCLGARPRRVRWIERNNSPLFAWWQTPDHRFTKAQFAVSYGAPILLSSAALLAYFFRFPTAAPVLGLILPFYLGNLWFALLAARRPGGTPVEPQGRGLLFHEPVVRASPA